MGKSITPTYRIETKRNGAWRVECAWDSKYAGKPSQAKLETWRTTYNTSFQPGGVNFHVSKSLGYVLHISHARIVKQSTGEIVCETTAPMFEIV